MDAERPDSETTLNESESLTETEVLASGSGLSSVSYDRAYASFLQAVFQGYMSDDDILKSFDNVFDRHEGPIRNLRSSVNLDQPATTSSVVMTIDAAAMRATDIDAHAVAVDGFANDLLAAQSRHFFESVVVLSNAAGTAVQNSGQGAPTLEQFRELMKQMAPAFDDDGKLNYQLIVDPSHLDRAKALLTAADNDEECQQILASKRKEWMELRASRSYRKLSR